MKHDIEIRNIIENTKQEILFAIKERIADITAGSSAPISLKSVVVRDVINSQQGSLRRYEIKNVFVDDNDLLRGDLIGRDDRYDDGILFGKDVEDLCIDDLKLILDTLYGNGWNIETDDMTDFSLLEKREGLYAFLAETKAGISRILRKGA